WKVHAGRGSAVTWRHQRGSPSTIATSELTWRPSKSVIHICPGVRLASYSAWEERTRLAIPMPLRLVIGLENTGKRGGGTPRGPASRPWLNAIAALSETPRWSRNHSPASLGSVGMFTPGGQSARSKYCRRQGSASQIVMDAQFDWNVVFIVEIRRRGQRRALGAPYPRDASNAGKDARARLRFAHSAVLERQRMN